MTNQKHYGFLKRFFDHSLSTRFFLILGFFDLLYVMYAMSSLPKNLLICGILSFLVPMLMLCYYAHLVSHEEIETIHTNHAGFFVTIVMPLVASGLIMFRHYHMIHFTSLLLIAALLLIVLYSAYHFMNKRHHRQDEALIVMVLLFGIPLSLIWINNTLPSLTTSTQVMTVVKKETFNAKYEVGYRLSLSSKKETGIFTITAKQYQTLSLGDKVIVTTSTGCLGLSYQSIQE